MRSIALLLCAAALLAEEPKPGKPVLLHSDAACFVHAVRGVPEASRPVERIVGPGHQLLHTIRTTGEMTVLVPATGTVAINTRRISFVQTRILGIAADEERLYVLIWSSGRVYDRPPDPGAPVEGGRHELRTFWLADGQPLAAPTLGAEGLPKVAPPETLGNGSLGPVKGGGECHGTRAVYKGRDLQP
jgi:hypothetical protein